MSRKKRVFDIDIPDEAVAPPAPEAKPRRGPMASAIAENAEALQARKSAVEKIREENDALAHEYVALREQGHVVQAVPLDEVHTAMLVRDRMPGDDPELEDLVTSIRELGLSNPIRGSAAPGRHGLRTGAGLSPADRVSAAAGGNGAGRLGTHPGAGDAGRVRHWRAVSPDGG